MDEWFVTSWHGGHFSYQILQMLMKFSGMMRNGVRIIDWIFFIADMICLSLLSLSGC